MLLKNLFKNKKLKGVSLVDVIIALGISTIVFTVIASFSTRLFLNVQGNYFKQAAEEILELIVERVRLLEFSMQEAVLKIRNGSQNVLPKNFDPVQAQTVWSNICSQDNSNNNNFIMDINLYQVIQNSGEYNYNFRLAPPNLEYQIIPPQSLFSGFSNISGSEVAYRIQKFYSDNNIQFVVFDVNVRYKVNGTISDYIYVGPTRISMLRNAICVL